MNFAVNIRAAGYARVGTAETDASTAGIAVGMPFAFTTASL